MIASLRQRRRSLAASLAVVFSAGWLSLAAAPCFADVSVADTTSRAASVPMEAHCPHCDDAQMPCGETGKATAAMTCDGEAVIPASFVDLKTQFVAIVPMTALQPVYAAIPIVHCPAAILAIPPPDIPATERFCSYHE